MPLHTPHALVGLQMPVIGTPHTPHTLLGLQVPVIGQLQHTSVWGCAYAASGLLHEPRALCQLAAQSYTFSQQTCCWAVWHGLYSCHKACQWRSAESVRRLAGYLSVVSNLELHL